MFNQNVAVTVVVYFYLEVSTVSWLYRAPLTSLTSFVRQFSQRVVGRDCIKIGCWWTTTGSYAACYL